MKAPRVKVVCATFSHVNFLKENPYPRSYSSAYEVLPFEYAGRRIENGKLLIYGYVKLLGVSMPVVKTIYVSPNVKRTNKGCFIVRDAPKHAPTALDTVAARMKRWAARITPGSKPERPAWYRFLKREGRVQMMTMQEIQTKRREQAKEVFKFTRTTKPKVRVFPIPKSALKRKDVSLRKHLAMKMSDEYGMTPPIYRYKGILECVFQDSKLALDTDDGSEKQDTLSPPVSLISSPMCASLEMETKVESCAPCFLPHPVPQKGFFSRLAGKIKKILSPSKKAKV